jgi:hypothetical protein
MKLKLIQSQPCPYFLRISTVLDLGPCTRSLVQILMYVLSALVPKKLPMACLLYMDNHVINSVITGNLLRLCCH